MIINHQHKFIFIKTRKTAGTSIEIALSQFCGSNDIITPIYEEEIRKQLGDRGAQNYQVPFWFYNKSDWIRFFSKRKTKKFFNHAPASFIQNNVRREIWDNYFKFCFNAILKVTKGE